MHTEIKNGEELSGKLTVSFKANKTFIQFCEKHFATFNAEQHEPIAIRMFYGDELIITLFALDRFRQEETDFDPKKVPVKKFKSSTLAVNEILPYLQEFNFTLCAGNYNLDEMQVINK